MTLPADLDPEACPRSRLWRLLHALVAAGPAFYAPAVAAQQNGWHSDGVALANQPEPSRAPAPLAPFDASRAASLIFDAELRTGVGWSTFSEDGLPLTDFVNGCADLSLGLGRFAGPHVRFGYELTVGARRVLGDRELHQQAGYSQPNAAIEGNTWYFLPVGAYLEIHPWARAGVSLGLHAGAGTFWPEPYLSGGNIVLAGAAALDVGYDDIWSSSRGWGLRLRYGAIGFRRSHIDEAYTTTQNSNELTLAGRISWF
ncbi:MAG: hypothetical protein ABI895_40220 [Deltaproteobacteria bacterium]